MTAKHNKRTRTFLFSVFLTIFLAFTLFYLTIPKMGYCFDAAFNETGDRLYVTAGYRGLHIFRITAEGKLKYLTTFYTSGYYRYLEVVGDKAYIANNERGLEVLDIQEDVPKPLWAQSGSKGYGIHVENDQVYLASNEYGLQIFDITHPEEPLLLGNLTTNGRMWDVWVNGGIAFLADRDLGLIVADVSSPTRPRQIGFITWGDDPMAEVIDGAGNYVYIAAGVNGLIVVDVSDPTRPIITEQYDPGLDSYGEGVLLRGENLFLSIDNKLSSDQNGLHILDITEPARPRLISRYPLSNSVEDIALIGKRLAIANTNSGVAVFDVQSVSNPLLIDTYPGRFWRFFTRMLK